MQPHTHTQKSIYYWSLMYITYSQEYMFINNLFCNWKRPIAVSIYRNKNNCQKNIKMYF